MPGYLDCTHCGAADERRELELVIYSQNVAHDGREAAWIGYGMGKTKAAGQFAEARALLMQVYADCLLDPDLRDKIRAHLMHGK